MTVMNGVKTQVKILSGSAVRRAVDSARRSAHNFDTEPIERRDEQHRHGGLAQGAEDQAGQGDAELACRKVAVHVLEDVLDQNGASASFLRQVVDARCAHLHERELGSNEEAVEQHEEKRCT